MKNMKWLAVAALLFGASGARIASAHGVECNYCGLLVVQDTPQLDNEVRLTNAGKNIEYRCVYCAIMDAKNLKGNVSIKAPTEAKGKFVTLTRKNNQWKSSKPGIVFIAEKVNHRHCQTAYRVITSRKAFAAYAKKNKDVVGNAKPLTLSQMINLTAA